MMGYASIDNVYSKPNGMFSPKKTSGNYGYTSILVVLFAQKSRTNLFTRLINRAIKTMIVILTPKASDQNFNPDTK